MLRRQVNTVKLVAHRFILLGETSRALKRKKPIAFRSCAGTLLREVILFFYLYLPAESVSALKLIVPVVVVVIVVGGVVVAVLS